MDVKKVSDRKIKQSGIRYKTSSVLMMRAIARERKVSINSLYDKAIEDYLINNRPTQ